MIIHRDLKCENVLLRSKWNPWKCVIMLISRLHMHGLHMYRLHQKAHAWVFVLVDWSKQTAFVSCPQLSPVTLPSQKLKDKLPTDCAETDVLI
jgi:hypothetical protein